MRVLLVRFAEDESGVTVIEYGLVGGLISVVIIAAATTVGQTLNTVFASIGASLTP
jgi:pilus assembly protein Flp/PilA